jgi:hypothetical protein
MSLAGVIGYAPRNRQIRPLAGGDEPVRQCQVAADVAVGAGRRRGRAHLVGDTERLGRLAEVPAGLERGDVGLGDVRLVGELLPDEGDGALGGPRIHPAQQAEGEHVLAAPGVLAAQRAAGQCVERQLREVDGVHVELVQPTVLDRVAGPAHPGQRPGGEVVRVHDQRRALGQVAQVRLQRGRVHRHQDVGTIARGEDVVVGEMQLEARDAGERALRRADLSREVREGREVVAEDRCLLGEAVPGELHAVAGVTGDADDDVVELFDALGHAGYCLQAGSRRASAQPRQSTFTGP